MTLNRTEVLLDAMQRLFGFPTEPTSLAYTLRNPVLLRSFAKVGKHETDENGIRIFPSLLAGYKAACYDLQLKLAGLSRCGLQSSDPLVDLLRVYGLGEQPAIDSVIDFLRRALNDESVSEQTPLSYFVEDK